MHTEADGRTERMEVGEEEEEEDGATCCPVDASMPTGVENTLPSTARVTPKESGPLARGEEPHCHFQYGERKGASEAHISTPTPYTEAEAVKRSTRGAVSPPPLLPLLGRVGRRGGEVVGIPPSIAVGTAPHGDTVPHRGGSATGFILIIRSP